MADTDHDKIIRTEEKLDALGKVVYEIKNNHLAHVKISLDSIEGKLENINIKMASWSGGIVVILWLAERFIK